MLSVCIPVYNKNITPLVLELSRQIEQLGASVEILVLDDGSSQAVIDARSEIKRVRLIRNEDNLGRSKARNRLLREANGPFMLLLDAGSEILNSRFLGAWIANLQTNHALVYYGGSIYQSVAPDESHYLHWKVGSGRESKSFAFRQKKLASFKTNNTVIHKQVFSELKFEESLVQYGHEDTLYGFELSQRNIEVRQVNNPVRNALKDTNEQFLKKTGLAIENLVSASDKASSPQLFREFVKLFKAYERIKRWRLLGVISWLDGVMLGWLEAQLLSGNRLLILLKYDLYKLLVLNRVLGKEN